jgi:hypothetical protein
MPGIHRSPQDRERLAMNAKDIKEYSIVFAGTRAWVAKTPKKDDWDVNGFVTLRDVFEYRTAFSVTQGERGAMIPMNSQYIGPVEGSSSKMSIECKPDNIISLGGFSEGDREMLAKLHDQGEMMRDAKAKALAKMTSRIIIPTQQ